MRTWYWRMDVSKESVCELWAYGKGGEKVRWPDGPSDDWLREFGFSTRAAAVRSAGGNYLVNKGIVLLDSRNIPDVGLRYEIHRCYEIVILDKKGNQVGESDYVYTCRADAEDLAKDMLRTAGEGC